MKYLNIFTIILLVVSCGFLVDRNRDRYEKFWSEFNDMAEILNDRIDRILYVKVLQEGDTLYFTSNDLEDTFWIINDTSITIDTFRIEYDLEFTDTFSNDRYLTGNEGLYLMGDVFIYPDQYSGNTYVINAKGDTIFKYIKKEKTTYLGVDSTEKNLYFNNE